MKQWRLPRYSSYSFLFCFLVASCNGVVVTDDGADYSNTDYPDGEYCATVDYYNPNTGTSSVYTLRVEVASQELVTIFWPNGGWLDESHFDPPDISTGEAWFTSDQGYEYEVQIIGDESDCN